MGKTGLNSALKDLSGRVDQWVYRQVKGRTIVSKRPDREGEENPSPAQLAQRARFNAANAYVKQVLADPCHFRAYATLAKERNRRVDRMVASDYLTPPEIEHIELAGYQGQPGDLIRVFATDDIEVVAVDVVLSTAAGTRLEGGPAVKLHGVWNYAATLVAPLGEKITITATAKDRPGNTTSATVSFP